MYIDKKNVVKYFIEECMIIFKDCGFFINKQVKEEFSII